MWPGRLRPLHIWRTLERLVVGAAHNCWLGGAGGVSEALTRYLRLRTSLAPLRGSPRGYWYAGLLS